MRCTTWFEVALAPLSITVESIWIYISLCDFDKECGPMYTASVRSFRRYTEVSRSVIKLEQ